jgi:hypothetical protein
LSGDTNTSLIESFNGDFITLAFFAEEVFFGDVQVVEMQETG